MRKETQCETSICCDVLKSAMEQTHEKKRLKIKGTKKRKGEKECRKKKRG